MYVVCCTKGTGCSWNRRCIVCCYQYGFLLNWFKAYPEFSTQDFFITGESYAGIYVPTLANRIVDGNAAGMPHINLKGIAVGDGCIGNSVGTCGDGPDSLQIEVDLFYGHGMISQPTYDDINALCKNWIGISRACERAANDAINSVGDINIYDVYDTCPGFVSGKASRKNAHMALGGKPIMHAPNRALEKNIGDPVWCVPDGSSDFMNNDAVKKALHVDKAPVGTWSDCSDIRYDSNLVSLLPTYPKLIANMNVRQTLPLHATCCSTVSTCCLSSPLTSLCSVRCSFCGCALLFTF